jgi:glutaredoxin
MHPRLTTLAAALAALASMQVLAQYKVIGPDGSVTYTDRPPSAGNAKVTPLSRSGTAVASTESPNPVLPAELRQAVQRFPVLLYSTNDCPPCDSGRQLLAQRGIPFTEKKIVTEDDVRALERVLGWRTVPSLTIGAQALRGLTTLEWNAYLDIAGYPKESKLPRNWQPPAATPLADRPAPRAAVAPPVEPPAPPPPPPAAESGDEPAPRIRF